MTTEAHISCVADVMWYSESDFLNESTMKNSLKLSSYVEWLTNITIFTVVFVIPKAFGLSQSFDSNLLPTPFTCINFMHELHNSFSLALKVKYLYASSSSQ